MTNFSITRIAILGLMCMSPICLADDIDDLQKAEALLLEEEAKLVDSNPTTKKAPLPTIIPSQKTVKKATPQQEIVSLKKQIDSQGRTNRKIKTENELLREQLAKSQAQVKELMAKVSKLRNELMIAETRVERLEQSAHPSDFNRSFTRKPAPKRPDPLLTEEQTQKASEQMPIATVVVEKANLRAGPGLANSPIMSVTKGTRLAVETRSDDWYRVVAPTGERAWISRDTVAFGRDSRSAPSRTVQERTGQNFDDDEEAAMKLIREM